MLVLSRKVGEEIVLPNCGVTIGVVAVNGNKVRLGIAAPPETSVHRKEVWHRIRESRECNLDSREQQGATATDGGTGWQHELSRKIAARTHGHLLGLEVEVIDGRLVVHGRTHSYYGKQLACAAALELMKAPDSAPFTQVELDIEVLRSG